MAHGRQAVDWRRQTGWRSSCWQAARPAAHASRQPARSATPGWRWVAGWACSPGSLGSAAAPRQGTLRAPCARAMRAGKVGWCDRSGAGQVRQQQPRRPHQQRQKHWEAVRQQHKAAVAAWSGSSGRRRQRQHGAAVAAAAAARLPQVAEAAPLRRQPRADFPQHDPVAVDVRLLGAASPPQHLWCRPSGAAWVARCHNGSWVQWQRQQGQQGQGQKQTQQRQQHASTTPRPQLHRCMHASLRASSRPTVHSPRKRGHHPRHVIPVQNLGHPHVSNLGGAVPADEREGGYVRSGCVGACAECVTRGVHCGAGVRTHVSACATHTRCALERRAAICCTTSPLGA